MPDYAITRDPAPFAPLRHRAVTAVRRWHDAGSPAPPPP